MKAMILAAGRGERLRPLTDRTPKALLQAGGKSLIAWHLGRLSGAGIREVVVNLAHLGDEIEAAVGEGRGFGLRVAYSREPGALETAGGIAFAGSLLGAEPFLLVNADIYCDFDLSALAGLSLGERLGHLVLVPNPPHRAAGDFSLVGGRVGDGAAPRYTYAGIAVLRPSLVAPVRAGQKAPLGPLLRQAAARGQLSGELHRGVWHDAGTPERLAALRKALE